MENCGMGEEKLTVINNRLIIVALTWKHTEQEHKLNNM